VDLHWERGGLLSRQGHAGSYPEGFYWVDSGLNQASASLYPSTSSNPTNTPVTSVAAHKLAPARFND
jgi:hypothetical protein